MIHFVIVLGLIILFSILAGFTLEKIQEANYEKGKKELELLKKEIRLKKQKIKEILKSKIDEKYITNDAINFISYMSSETDESINYYSERYIKLLIKNQPEIFI